MLLAAGYPNREDKAGDEAQHDVGPPTTAANTRSSFACMGRVIVPSPLSELFLPENTEAAHQGVASPCGHSVGCFKKNKKAENRCLVREVGL